MESLHGGPRDRECCTQPVIRVSRASRSRMHSWPVAGRTCTTNLPVPTQVAAVTWVMLILMHSESSSPIISRVFTYLSIKQPPCFGRGTHQPRMTHDKTRSRNELCWRLGCVALRDCCWQALQGLSEWSCGSSWVWMWL